MYKLVFALVMMVGLQIVRVASFNLTIRPDYVRVDLAAQSVTFTCSADVALAGCQVRWWDYLGTKAAGPLLELSRGSQSQADPAHLNKELTGYSYSGRGLGAGDCGVTLQVAAWKLWMVACRVRTEDGGWKYAWADLYAGISLPLPHTLTQREQVVLPGGEARIMLKSGEPLSNCWFWLLRKSAWLYFNLGAESAQSTGWHLYLGAGLESGECGLLRTNISEVDNGPASVYIKSTTDKGDFRYTALVVARRPTAPTLNLVYTRDNVTATCEVQESRPVASMSWVLGDAVILKDVITHATAQDEWRWPWTTGSIKQTLTLQLQPQHNGMVLKCMVSHVTLPQPLEERRTIAFTMPTTTTTSNITASTAQGPNCVATYYLDLLCREYRVRPSQHGNTSCPKDEVHEYRMREAEAAAKTAEIEEEAAKTKLEAAKSSARASEIEEETAKAERIAKSEVARMKLDAEKIATEAAKVALESAKFIAKAEESRAKAEESRAKAEESRATALQLEVETAKAEKDAKSRSLHAAQIITQLKVDAARSHARAEESWAQNAEEELQFERERRTKSLQHSQSPQSQQG